MLVKLTGAVGNLGHQLVGILVLVNNIYFAGKQILHIYAED